MLGAAKEGGFCGFELLLCSESYTNIRKQLLPLKKQEYYNDHIQSHKFPVMFLKTFKLSWWVFCWGWFLGLQQQKLRGERMARSPWDFCTWKRRKFSKVVCMSWTVSWYFKMFHVLQFFEVILQVSFNLLMLSVGPILAFVAIFQFALGHVGSKLFATLSDQQGGNPQNGKVGRFPHVSPTVCKMKLGNWEWGASRVRFLNY